MSYIQRDSKIYDKYVEDCEKNDISQFSYNKFLFKYRKEYFPFDFFLTASEFMSANDIIKSHDKQNRYILSSKIRDELVNELTDKIIIFFEDQKNKTKKWSTPMSSWTVFFSVLFKDNSDPITPMFIYRKESDDVERPKITPVLVLYLRHGYIEQFKKLAPYFTTEKKKRTKLPKELIGKDLEWNKIDDYEWVVIVKDPVKKTKEEFFWESLYNEDYLSTTLEEYIRNNILKIDNVKD